MPQASEELRREWNGPGEDTAVKFLEYHGYVMHQRTYTWVAPQGHKPTAKELRAIQFLMDEWDFGGLADVI